MASFHIRSKKLLLVAPSEQEEITFMGMLMWKFGFNLLRVEEQEKAQKTQYNQIIPLMRQERLSRTFYTPKHHCTFVEDVNEAEVVIFLLNITTSISDTADKSRLAEIWELVRRGLKVVVVIDGMQDKDWALQHYQDRVASVKDASMEDDGDVKAVRFVPLSSASGENVLDSPKRSPWHSEELVTSGAIWSAQTLVEAIDC